MKRLLGMVLAALLLAACSTPVETSDVESKIETSLAEKGFTATVDCPEGMKSRQGTTSDCIATFDDDTIGRVEVRWQNDEGDLVWQVQPVQ
ncbi:DUF4333 domain-containing protein [Aeromicrobium sp. 50.2.37]|uniref:DUF4333 domain-containing protein n=1 Tax=Aeromicrobium sp. 50.2.37 TaxID=2969305 RepID=UPI0021505608|nr:DUF4333 domain-containing protein [Aeromicrobium sp. 50.2.37]MCR4514576.1 DUF4333 domain-containing protein [Aeromicrobium sp. 50.2.37]